MYYYINFTDNGTLIDDVIKWTCKADAIRLSVGQMSLIALLLLVFLFGTIGNILVFYWFGVTPRRKLAGSVFVATLAAVDLITSVYLPIDLIHKIVSEAMNPCQPPWLLGRVACYVKATWDPVFLFASSWLLVAISIVRWR